MPYVRVVLMLSEWVDFHYDANGKMYDFSIPGGGFVTMQQLVEVLGIANGDAYSENTPNTGETAEALSEENEENGTAEESAAGDTGAYAENNGSEGSGEEQSAENNDAHADTANEEIITLNNVTVSEATKNFVADIADVKFSNSELVWVGKTEESTTVGQLKKTNGLECQYSVKLTEEQIEEINGSSVEAGDWVLISVQSFISDETLTVTMKNGDQFVIKVSDGQQVTEYAEIDRGIHYIIYIENTEYYYGRPYQQYYALKNDGTSVRVNNNDLESLGSEFYWRYDYDETACWWYSDVNNKYIEPEWELVVGDNPGGKYLWVDQRQDGRGFDIHGDYWTDNYLFWDQQRGFTIQKQYNIQNKIPIKIYMKEKLQFNFNVAVNNENYGSVTCENKKTGTDHKNLTDIVATPAEGCYFVGWRLGNEILSGYDSTIPAGTLEFTDDNQTLTAVFGKNYTSPATQEINEWIDSLLGNPLESDKTAHVYDYDNRIYEVNLNF